MARRVARHAEKAWFGFIGKGKGEGRELEQEWTVVNRRFGGKLTRWDCVVQEELHDGAKEF